MLQKIAAIMLVVLAAGGLVYHLLRQRKEDACRDCSLRDRCAKRTKSPRSCSDRADASD